MSYILTFDNTHAAIFAEKALLQAGYPVGVMPVPSGIRAGCGIALRVDDYIASSALLEKNNIIVAAVYQASVTNNLSTEYKKLA